MFGDVINRLICCLHLKGNLSKQYSRNVSQFFQAIADAKTNIKYTATLNALWQYNFRAADYFTAIEKSLWVTAFYCEPYFGHKTSNVVESMNKVFCDTRELSILDLVNQIWHYTMNQQWKHYQKRCELEIWREQVHTEFCLRQLRENAKWAQWNTVQMASAVEGIVTQGNNQSFIINLTNYTGSCEHFQRNWIPWSHAFSCILELHQSPCTFVPYIFTITAWKSTNLSNIVPISLKDIVVDEVVQYLGKEWKSMGRPQVLRMVHRS